MPRRPKPKPADEPDPAAPAVNSGAPKPAADAPATGEGSAAAPVTPPPPPEPPAPPASPSPSDALPTRTLAEAIIARVGAVRHGLMLQGHTAFIPFGKSLIVAVRNDMALDYYEQVFGPDIRAAVVEVYGPGMSVDWIVDEHAVNEAVAGNEPRPAGEVPPASAEPAETAAKPKHDLFGETVPEIPPKPKRDKPEVAAPGRQPRPARRWKTLDEFVVSPQSNQFALASAVNVVNNPGGDTNPLVIFGPVGTGKTHLLEGIYSGLKRSSDQRPNYLTAEQFTNSFVNATKHAKMSAFRRHFEENTALLFDDLHYLSTRRQTQQEFINTFNAFIADGRQVAVTLDCHPRNAEGLMPELVDRLLGGVICQLSPPDRATRLEILHRRSGGLTPPIPDAVLQSLAENLQGNVRVLEGAINSIRHFAATTGRPIDLSLVSEALGETLRHNVRVVTMADVDAAVAATLRLPAGTLQARSRARSVTNARMIAIYLCREHTAASFQEIARHFGMSTHTTAINSDRRVRALLEKNLNVAIGDRNWPVQELVARIDRELQR